MIDETYTDMTVAERTDAWIDEIVEYVGALIYCADNATTDADLLQVRDSVAKCLNEMQETLKHCIIEDCYSLDNVMRLRRINHRLVNLLATAEGTLNSRLTYD